MGSHHITSSESRGLLVEFKRLVSGSVSQSGGISLLLPPSFTHSPLMILSVFVFHQLHQHQAQLQSVINGASPRVAFLMVEDPLKFRRAECFEGIAVFRVAARFHRVHVLPEHCGRIALPVALPSWVFHTLPAAAAEAVGAEAAARVALDRMEEGGLDARAGLFPSLVKILGVHRVCALAAVVERSSPRGATTRARVAEFLAAEVMLHKDHPKALSQC